MNNYFIEFDIESIAEESIAAVKQGNPTIQSVDPHVIMEIVYD